MPRVGGKKFSYDKAGMEAAAAARKAKTAGMKAKVGAAVAKRRTAGKAALAAYKKRPK